MTTLAPAPIRLDAAEWRARETAHIARADALTAGHRARAARGEKHPVEDFLFTYYSYKPSVLRRWHPGAGVELAAAAATSRAGWRWYVAGDSVGALRVDAAGFRDDRALLVAGVEKILRSTAGRAGSFGCFGLHEWAMVYRRGEHRHPVALRLGQDGTDAVVEEHDLRCTHFDAFRFFTADAAPRNREAPTRDTQPALEQPGCLHAGMDLYKWAVKLGPLVPGELLLDSFELARDIRVLDMEASPYDLADHGYRPVRIETAEGKAEYVRRQRGFSLRGQELRARLLAALGG
ncbi:3-methyladenine DNA glycosylase [Microbacterium sp. BK668]|uniref:3-methyladenine DNA glycosylase n=1 Tax=Microbacterium sp. BK668 TaxID=2512118 RepID=UPI001FB6E169|nr:3-methyladenine DNA glycosylase [Microbacterium sp. BK668]